MAKVLLRESFQLDAETTVDEDAGIIRNVRVLGASSRNCHGVPNVTKGSRYTKAAMESGCQLYNGTTVLIDHNRKDPGAERSTREVLGKLENCHVVMEDGEPVTRGDLPYYKSDPFAQKVVEDVKRKIGNFGLSHHAYTDKASVKDGVYVIESIAEVKSVDLVLRAAANRNLWESQEPMKHTLRQILEAHKAKYPKTVKCLFEEDMPSMDAPVTDEPVDHEQALDDGFAAALKALVDNYISGSIDAEAASAKFKEILKAHSKIKGGKEDKEEKPEPPAEPPADDSKQESEQLKRTNAALRCILEAGIVKPSPVLMKALESLPTDDDRKALLAEQKKETSTVRSTVPGHTPVVESTDPKNQPVDVKKSAARIRE